MKSALIFTLLACGACWGQTAGECKPSSLNIPGAPYPCVYPDNRVAFRVAAPDAPYPYAPPLEDAFLPNADKILAAARKLAAY